jgi:AcrR family transcriptional regulator
MHAIGRGGLAAVAVEPLARTLGVTKGSFYAHYRNRDELVDAALAEWELHGQDVLVPYAAITDPAERLRRLIAGLVQAVETLVPSVHLALLGELGDRRVLDSLRRVNGARLDLLTRTYREVGMAPDRAADRARIVYAASLGLLHLAQQARALHAADEESRRPAPGEGGGSVDELGRRPEARLAALIDESTAIFLPDAADLH